VVVVAVEGIGVTIWVVEMVIWVVEVAIWVVVVAIWVVVAVAIWVVEVETLDLTTDRVEVEGKCLTVLVIAVETEAASVDEIEAVVGGMLHMVVEGATGMEEEEEGTEIDDN